MTPEITSALTQLNRFNNFTYKVKSNDFEYILYKQFHQNGKNAKTTRMYAVELYRSCNPDFIVNVINALNFDHEY